MKELLRKLSACLLVSALAGMVALLIFDVFNRLNLTLFHQRMGALSFMLVGASYISLQFSTAQHWREKLKRVLLGVGFFLWGSEQFLSRGPFATLVDSLVVIIFVSDLSLVIMDSLKSKDDQAP